MSIENVIKIMLKGACDYSSIDDIKEKLKKAQEEKRPLILKLGLDPTAPDIHLGHTVVLRKIKQLQDLGHKAVIIIGDYTARIGDPSGKSKTRKPLTQEQIKKSASTYKKQIFKVLDKSKTEVRFNSEWLSKLNFADIIELSSKCTVARILERDDFSNRFKNHLPLSLHEILYPLAQAYDSVAIKADVEIGGSDQTFNILMGRSIQKSYGQDSQITLFMPIIEGLDGTEKMSKSLNNYVGIDESAYVMYEKVMSIPDELIIKYYNLLTDVHPDKIKEIEKKLETENKRDVKMELALEVVKLYHGKDASKEAQDRFVKLFQKKEIPDDIEKIRVSSNPNTPLFEQLVSSLLETKKFSSKSDIRRIFLQGGVQINEEKITKIDEIPSKIKKDSLIRLGKKKIFKIILE